jgi:O-antigen/teichoic acid export membrane protein
LFPIVAFAFLYAAPVITLIFGAQFSQAASSWIILMCAEVFLLANIISQSILVAAGLQRYTLVLSIAAAGSNIALNLVLIPRMGISGAAVASLVSYGMYSVAQIAIPATRRSAEILLGEIWRPLAAAAVMCAVIALLQPGMPIGILCLGAGYVAVLIMIGGLRESDLSLIRRALARPAAAPSL